MTPLLLHRGGQHAVNVPRSVAADELLHDDTQELRRFEDGQHDGQRHAPYSRTRVGDHATTDSVLDLLRPTAPDATPAESEFACSGKKPSEQIDVAIELPEAPAQSAAQRARPPPTEWQARCRRSAIRSSTSTVHMLTCCRLYALTHPTRPAG